MRSPAELLAARDDRRRAAIAARLRSVLAALDVPVPSGISPDRLPILLASQLRADRPDVLWLVLATITGTLPLPGEVAAAARSCDFDGAPACLARIIRSARPDASRLRGDWASVQIVVGAVLVDLHHTSQTDLATGIQRVARRSAQRWQAEHDITLVGWSRFYTHLRPLSPAQVQVALHGGTPGPIDADGPQPVIVPWRSTYLLPELMTERERALRLQALISHSGSRTGAIGFDCVPITSAETIGEGMGAAFSANLTAIARMDRVVTISDAAATEYRGWKAMLTGAGLAGPSVTAVDLAVEASPASPTAVADARREFGIGTLPLVLVVGSHEPRKNHLAILHAAELLWREGHRFNLSFVGGNAWKGERFLTRLAQLQAVGRPVQSISALSEEMLWAAYEIASFTVFPSLNEGFGLPVAESLATGTPVITAGYGSMRQIAASGGALLIDPRSDAALTDAMRTLLTDPRVHARLAAEAQMVTGKSWDKYAFEVWQHFMESEEPSELASAAAPAALENGNR
jgi:glycosyltransferase involved in cell wall biosynthesis